MSKLCKRLHAAILVPFVSLLGIIVEANADRSLAKDFIAECKKPGFDVDEFLKRKSPTLDNLQKSNNDTDSTIKFDGLVHIVRGVPSDVFFDQNVILESIIELIRHLFPRNSPAIQKYKQIEGNIANDVAKLQSNAEKNGSLYIKTDDPPNWKDDNVPKILTKLNKENKTKPFFVQPNFLYKIDTHTTDPAVHPPDQEDPDPNLDTINAFSAWQSTSRGDGPPVVVGILDSGINVDHIDLQKNLWSKKNQAAAEQFHCLEHNKGYGCDFIIDKTNGYSQETILRDLNGHGTKVAGIIGAEGDNKTCSVGIAWKSNVKIMALKVADNFGYVSGWDAARAINYAKRMGAKRIILNLSFGYGTNFDFLLYKPIKSSPDVLFVASMGNHGKHFKDNPYLPAAYSQCNEIENIIPVFSIDARKRKKARFSGYGLADQLGAPGTNVCSTTIGSEYECTCAYNNGTSFAVPFVSGAAAQLWAEHPEWFAKDIKSQLLEHAQPIGGAPVLDLDFLKK